MKRRGQSVLEYVIIITAVVAGILLGLEVFGTKSETSGLGKLFNKTKTLIETKSAVLLNTTGNLGN